ncbi:MAG: hypothetical protein KBB40_06780 [Clostridia bacterium]|jgi:hypothetical protein|nr:hypothetical protein [Clostridia bacterium]
MGKVIRLLVFTVLVMIMFAVAAYADSIDTGWNGYGLYNLNKSDVSITNESDNITVNGGKVTAVYEYTIKSNADKDISVNFGIPDNGIVKFSIYDGSKYLNYKTRNTSYLKSTYGAENLQTPDGRWYLFTMVFKPGQTRSISISIEAEMIKAENDTYGLSFFKDRGYSYAIKSEKVRMTLNLSDFKPYYIYELEGIKEEQISDDGVAALSFSGDYGNGVFLRYQPIDKMALDSLGKSTYKKPKSIVKAFNEKKYGDALTLCNEYISSPSDSSLNLEQVKFIKAECIRLSGNYAEYLSAVEQLDISQLYPGRVRFKILHDRLTAYKNTGNAEGVNMILKELIPETQQIYPFLYHWLDRNGYKLEEAEPDEEDAASRNNQVSTAKKGFDILGAVIGFFTFVTESRWTYVLLGFLAGFIIGRLTKRRKKSKSVYLFRD